MKRAELEIGKVYAYSRQQNPSSLYHIDGFIVDDISPQKDWRGRTTQEIKGRFTDSNGNPKESSSTILPRFLIGDYITLKHDLEIRQKNKEIRQLKEKIEADRMEGLIKAKHEVITTRLGINWYDTRNQYDGRATITLNGDQFQKLVWAFESLTRHEEHAQRLEAERIQKAYEESLTNANL